MIIGITGVFGCGKSTCIKLLKELNLDVTSPDEICHQIYPEKDPSFLTALKNRWMIEILDKNGEIDRRKIAEIVFNNPEEMNFLTEIISPIIKSKINEKITQYKKNNATLIVEIPLLFEENYKELLDKTVTIYASMEQRISNLAQRNYSEKDIIARDKMQLPLEKKAELADFVIVNSGSIDFLRKEIIDLVNKLGI